MTRRLAVHVVLLGLTACRPPAPEAVAPGPSPQGAKQPPAAPAQRTKVVLYSPHGREILEPFEQRFETAHPGYDLEWRDMGSQEVLDRLRAEKANPQCDVWWGAPHTMFAEGGEDGLLEAYRPTWAEQLDPARHDPQDRWYGVWLTPTVIVFNSAVLTKATAPQDWDDLLEPEWQDKLLIRDPLNSGTMRTFIAAMILRQASVEKGYEWLLKLDANTKDYPATPALLHLGINKQEGLVTVWVLHDAVIQARVNHYTLDYVMPKSGCPVVNDGIALVQGAPHPDGAKTLYEYATSGDNLVWCANQFFCIPARQDIDRDKLPDRMPLDIAELKMDWARVQSEGNQWCRHWDSQIKNRGK